MNKDDILEEALTNGYESSSKKFNIEIVKVKEIVLNFRLENLNESNLCHCICHQIGLGTLHFTSCCELTYEKYINKDGTFNKELYSDILKERL